MRLVVGMVGGLALSAVACGGGGDGNGGASGLVSCTVSEGVAGAGTLKICEEASASERQAIEQSCAQSAAGGLSDAGLAVSLTYSNGPCSHVGALGACRETVNGVTEDGWYYATGGDAGSSAGGQTSADIQMLCALAGATFLPP